MCAPLLLGGRFGLDPADRNGAHGLRSSRSPWVLLDLAGRELRAGNRSGEVRRRRLGGEAEHRAVDVDAGGAVRRGLAGGGVNARQQVGPSGGQVEHLVLVDLALVETFLDRL